MDLFRDVPGVVADFGCGEGVFVSVSSGYLGLDSCIDLARDVRAAGGNSAAADIRFTPLRDGSCGGVLCVNTLQLVAEPERVIKEIDRVLCPGGRAYVKNRWYMTGGRRFSLYSIIVRALHRARFMTHFMFHRAGQIFASPNFDGSRAICPSCFRRFFVRRGYEVRILARHVVILIKPDDRDSDPRT